MAQEIAVGDVFRWLGRVSRGLCVATQVEGRKVRLECDDGHPRTAEMDRVGSLPGYELVGHQESLFSVAEGN